MQSSLDAFAVYRSPAQSAIPYDKDELFAPAKQRVFSGKQLAQISFPLGGIGTGTIGLGGRGDLRDWEIWNRPSKGRALPFTFVALWARPHGGKAVQRIVEAPPQAPYTGWMGYDRSRAQGLPRMRETTFRGEYPFAWIDFADEAVPLRVSLEAYTPFVPMDVDASSVPVAILRYRLTNPGKTPVDAALAFSLLNAVGYDPRHGLGDRSHGGFGQNVNEFRRADGLVGLLLRSEKYTPDDLAYGTMALATTAGEYTYRTRWEHGVWWDEIQLYWDEFCAEGRLADREPCGPSEDGRSEYCALAPRVVVAPGETVEVPFYLGWHFPNRENYWNPEEEVKGARLRNDYAARFGDAWDVVSHAVAVREEHEAGTRAFHKALFEETTLPWYVIDAVSANASIIRSTTCMLLEGRRFYGFEGCSDDAGCCWMNCTHVWNYEQTLAFLFPELERSMRRSDYESNVREDGSMAFRTFVPEGRAVWSYKPAADGQFGTVVKLYREWKLSGDTDWVRALWPQVKRTIEYAWQHWDPDRDGVMEGEQHNTYDIEFYGPNTMMGSCYLAGLLAGAEMAAACGDGEAAALYRELAAKGRERMERELWNGEYYVQVYEEAQAPKYQYGAGCLSDQLLGQYLAHAAGLGHLFDPERVREAMRSIYRYNFRPNFYDHANCQRIYALNDEAGLLLCSWPRGGRPALPFVYSDEVWTGIEYQVAANMIYEGLLDEGLALTKAVRDRHDGERRNPWDEFECGHHYARALASYAVLLALTGFHYDGVAGALTFAPRYRADRFQTFFAAGTGWGVFREVVLHGRSAFEIDLYYGSLALNRLVLGRDLGKKAERCELKHNDVPAAADVVMDRGALYVQFAQPLALHAGDCLTLGVTMR